MERVSVGLTNIVIHARISNNTPRTGRNVVVIVRQRALGLCEGIKAEKAIVAFVQSNRQRSFLSQLCYFRGLEELACHSI